MPKLIESLRGLDDFLVYFVAALALLVLFLAIYVRTTPYREIALIREGNNAAAASLSGAMLGFILPLASAIVNSAALWEMMLWGAIALIAQLVAYGIARLLLPHLAQDIAAGKTASGVVLGALSIGIGILSAASMTY